jgi:hypothetical protein
MRPACLALFLSAVLSLPLTALPGDAEAGGYDVHACETSWSPPANNAFVGQADGGMTVYADCPAGEGIVARNVFDNGTTTSGTGAYLFFDAPPGTYIGSMDFDAGVERHDCGYSVLIVAGGHDMGGTAVWGPQAGHECDSWQWPGPGNFFPSRFSVPVNAERARVQVRCANGSTCNRNGVAAIRMRNVVVHVVDNYGPALSGGRGGLWDSGNRWLAGNQSLGFDANDGSGIRDLSVQVDGKEITHKSKGCDFTKPAPCPQGASTDEQFSTSGFGGDGDHQVILVASDAAGNPSSVAQTVHIDNTAPDAPTDLVLDGGDGWRKANSFDVRWVNPTAAGAPIAGALWELCREGSDAKNCTTGSKDGDGITALQGLTVPKAGAYTLKVWLRDSAGNQEKRLAAAPATLRYDETSPTVTLKRLTAEDPTLVAAPASDDGAGVTGGEIAIRKEGSDKWKSMPTTLEGSEVRARIDDEHLSDGTYNLMVRATDGAGNERVATTFADGQPAQVKLPLRLKTKLVAGVAKRSRGRLRLLRSAYASYGSLVRVRGRLVTPEGNPMQDVEIRAFTQVRDGVSPPRLIATVKTTKSGAYSFVVQKGPSRTIRVEYAGAGQIRSASKRLVLYVRSSSTIRPSQRRLVNGETLRLSGKVRTGRIPVKGKLIQLEVLNRGRCRTFATTRATRRGAWKYDYRFDGTRGLQNYRFRATIPRETGYPFAAGGSKVVVVRVRGV